MVSHELIILYNSLENLKDNCTEHILHFIFFKKHATDCKCWTHLGFTVLLAKTSVFNTISWSIFISLLFFSCFMLENSFSCFLLCILMRSESAACVLLWHSRAHRNICVTQLFFLQRCSLGCSEGNKISLCHQALRLGRRPHCVPVCGQQRN